MAMAMRLSLLLFSTSLLQPCLAQAVWNDSTLLKAALLNAIGVYEATMGAQSHLFNGSEYKMYSSMAGEHPYFMNDWSEGEVLYEGQRYTTVPLLYDLSGDKLITENESGRLLQLISEKVTYFILDSHTFVYLTGPKIKEGFYDRLYPGDTKIYKRIRKSLQKSISGTLLEKKFEESIQYFIYTRGNYIPARKKKDVFAALPDKSNELKKFLRENHIHFRSDPGAAMTRMARFYDQIQQQP